MRAKEIVVRKPVIPMRNYGGVRIPDQKDSAALKVPDVAHPPFRELAVPAFRHRLQDSVMGLDQKSCPTFVVGSVH